MNTAAKFSAKDEQKNLWQKLKSAVPPGTEILEWHTVADILDNNAPEWSYEVRSVNQIGDAAVVVAALTIALVTREGVGTGDANSETGIKAAEHEALKHAAVKFGIGRELYKQESERLEREIAESNYGGVPFPENHVARSQFDLVTPKQIGMMRALARELGIDLEEECNRIWTGSKTDELSKKAGSSFIQHLQDLKKSKDAPTAASSPQKPATAAPVPAASNVSNFPQNSEQFSPEEKKQIENWRSRIAQMVGKVGINPVTWLAEYDTHNRTFAAKKKTFEAAMKKASERQFEHIGKGLTEQGWNQAQIDAEFAKYGIRGGLPNATPEQIDRMWTAFKRERVI
jgi:hypothetical protein